MRNEYKRILGEELRVLAIQTRAKHNLSQREMGERLYISESSYSDIERGVSHCSATTAALLLEMQDDPKAFLQMVREKYTQWYETEMRTA
ncbi:MAG: helix-turn-helix transcriptional regulator [Clostridia bacterium]|nr:helix-turn-helix transcriptional regulator [Clostridia bacterium]